MKDDLLDTLKTGDRLLKFVAELNTRLAERSFRFGCRPTNIYVGLETKPYKNLTVVVDENGSVPKLTTGVKKFGLDHVDIAKPPDKKGEVYAWVNDIIEREMKRLNTWPPSPHISRKEMHRGAESAKVVVWQPLSEDSRAPR
jgi:hypothetical protein